MKKFIYLSTAISLACLLYFGMKRSLKITFNGKVTEGAEVHFFNTTPSIFKIDSKGMIELPDDYRGGSLIYKIVYNGEVLSQGHIQNLELGKHHFDFRDNSTFYKHQLFFYTSEQTSWQKPNKEPKQ